jgi:hypothetical protein
MDRLQQRQHAYPENPIQVSAPPPVPTPVPMRFRWQIVALPLIGLAGAYLVALGDRESWRWLRILGQFRIVQRERFTALVVTAICATVLLFVLQAIRNKRKTLSRRWRRRSGRRRYRRPV